MLPGLNDRLNPEQLLAATTIDGPLLIIAGAGSGKTRTITYRIANMLHMGIPQSSILALTFTNKAAREMSERIRELAGKPLRNLTVSTFHAFGVKILRRDIHHLGYKDNFSIYDSVDKISLIKECARELHIPRDAFDAYQLSNLFSGVKTHRSTLDEESELSHHIFEEYQDHLRVYNAVDFDDLIVLPIRLFSEKPEVLEWYRNRYGFIMVDEFQDTSMVQYQFVRAIAGEHRNICVVGDDDQSIYSWRGANYLNLVQFERDFPETREIKLEQNYRSTKNILAAANSIIANNTNRKVKALWTGTGEGRSIELYFPENEQLEAGFIAEMIKTLAIRERVRYESFGVLVRTNSLTAAIENAFLQEDIPYHVSGGTSFFQRKEIKDIIAYLRVLVNPDDDVNLLRIINTPRRGIGKKSIQEIRAIAESRHISLYSALSALRWAADSPLAERTHQAIEEFLILIEFYQDRIGEKGKLAETISGLVDRIDYWGYLLQEFSDNDKAAKWKYRNIQTFIDVMSRWEEDPENEQPSMYDYLNRISLITRDDVTDESGSGRVNLMTIHSAKGLEFDIVFLPGVEEGIIPHARALEENPDNIEEERRLFYVAVTRAKQTLYITSCRTRRQMREVIDCSPSAFLDEIPRELIEIHEPKIEVDEEEALEYFQKMRAALKG